MKMVNKKAQDLSIGTLILIVLGIVVLVLLILGFSLGWSNLWQKINIFGGSSSIGDIVTACNLAATSQNNYDYCQNFRQIKVNGATEYLNCQDGRVVGQLNTQLTCSTEIPASSTTWAQWYCNELKTGNKITDRKPVKINGGELSCF